MLSLENVLLIIEVLQLNLPMTPGFMQEKLFGFIEKM